MEEMNNQEPITDNTQNSVDNTFDQIIQDAVKIQDLVKNGTLNSQQGQYYMSQLAQKSLLGLKQQDPVYNAFDEFNKDKPDFFKSEGRNDVLNYLKKSDVLVDKDEINTISEMVEKIEKCAIDRYIKQQAHQKVLNDENEAAKRRLSANAQNSLTSPNKNMTFTREQIGRMSGAEFTKFEPIIMEQLKKGQIK